MNHPTRIDTVALSIALAVLLTGFGMLCCLWFFGRWPSHVPGLFDYRSATWGDGILLPISAFALAHASRQLPPASGELQWNIAAALAGVTVAAAAQILWLLDPHPRLNWTIPAPHRLNYAGVYHAVFLVAASGLFTVLWVLALRRMRAARPIRASHFRGSGLWIVVALLCTGAFFALLMVDNQAARDTATGQITLVVTAIGVLSLLMLFGWTFRSRRSAAS
jgi:ABC-type Co2+ transport system permease subunit